MRIQIYSEDKNTTSAPKALLRNFTFDYTLSIISDHILEVILKKHFPNICEPGSFIYLWWSSWFFPISLFEWIQMIQCCWKERAMLLNFMKTKDSNPSSLFMKQMCDTSDIFLEHYNILIDAPFTSTHQQHEELGFALGSLPMRKTVKKALGDPPLNG